MQFPCRQLLNLWPRVDSAHVPVGFSATIRVDGRRAVDRPAGPVVRVPLGARASDSLVLGLPAARGRSDPFLPPISNRAPFPRSLATGRKPRAAAFAAVAVPRRPD